MLVTDMEDDNIPELVPSDSESESQTESLGPISVYALVSFVETDIIVDTGSGHSMMSGFL